MKKIFIGILFTSAYIFIGCEQPLNEEEFPYEIKLVVRNLVLSNKLIDSIYVGRTLPVSVPFDKEFAKVTTAVGAVISDGIFYPLRHKGNGYYTTDSLIARPGKTYYLIINWENISVNAETTVPVIGNINNSYVNQGINEGSAFSYLESSVSPFSDEVYGAVWFVMTYTGFITFEADEFERIVKKEENAAAVLVPTIEIPQSYINSNGSYGIRIYAFDKSYYDYFITSNLNQIPDAIFGQSGSAVKWNINGNGIGMFVGRADTTIVIATN
jgi:hypothetical protein